MGSNNSKYSDEMRERTAKHIMESGKSATSMAEELGIDTNTVCRWVRDYRRKNNLPSYTESHELKQRAPVESKNLANKIKEMEKTIKKKDKELADEKEKVEILKKSLHIFMQHPE